MVTLALFSILTASNLRLILITQDRLPLHLMKRGECVVRTIYKEDKVCQGIEPSGQDSIRINKIEAQLTKLLIKKRGY